MYSSSYCSRRAPPATRTDQLATSVFPLAIKRDACVFGFAFVLCSYAAVCGSIVGVFVCVASGLFSGINYELGTIIPPRAQFPKCQEPRTCGPAAPVPPPGPRRARPSVAAARRASASGTVSTVKTPNETAAPRAP